MTVGDFVSDFDVKNTEFSVYTECTELFKRRLDWNALNVSNIKGSVAIALFHPIVFERFVAPSYECSLACRKTSMARWRLSFKSTMGWG